jgi:2-polyprenyl-3-methyl-5-hydroxy-6-metoxy-1,4-benzoquinol methylase
MSDEEGAPLFHVSNAVMMEFAGGAADRLTVRSRATGNELQLDMVDVPLFTAFTRPTSFAAAAEALSERGSAENLLAAFEMFREAGILVPWRAAMDKDEALAAIAGVKRWYHSFELAPGLHTQGEVPAHPRRLEQVGMPDDLRGKRALDIGAWDGPYSFEMERRGAEVVAFDIQDPTHTGFDVARRILGSKVEYVRGSVYELTPERVGTFDVVLYFGVFYHLKHPLKGFLNIQRVMRDDAALYLEGAVLEASERHDRLLAKNADALRAVAHLPLAYFSAGDAVGHWSNWFVPNLACVREWLLATGFRDPDLKLLGNNRGGGVAYKDPSFGDIEHEVI